MNNHAARIERVAQIRPADLSQPPMLEELQAEIEKMQADPDYVCRWSDEMLESWITQLEAELAP